MVDETLLLRTTQKVTSYLAQHVKLAGIDRREEVIELFDNMLQLFPHWVIMTCPFMHPHIRYVSRNYDKIFGHTREGAINTDAQTYFSYVHGADQQDLYDCFSFVHDYLEAMEYEEH